MTSTTSDFETKIASVEETKNELLSHLQRAMSLAQKIEAGEPGAKSDSHALEELEEQNTELANRLFESEVRNNQMLALYVATYQLYDARDPEQVVETIAEITRDILGAQKFLLIVKLPPADGYSIAMRHGLEDGCPEVFATQGYSGGVEVVDRALAEGIRHFDPDGNPLAVIPLQMNSSTVGALVLLELLAHKKAFSGNDREIIDLLGAHTASALMASESWAAISRRVNTLESLLRLARGVS